MKVSSARKTGTVISGSGGCSPTLAVYPFSKAFPSGVPQPLPTYLPTTLPIRSLVRISDDQHSIVLKVCSGIVVHSPRSHGVKRLPEPTTDSYMEAAVFLRWGRRFMGR